MLLSGVITSGLMQCCQLLFNLQFVCKGETVYIHHDRCALQTALKLLLVLEGFALHRLCWAFAAQCGMDCLSITA